MADPIVIVSIATWTRRSAWWDQVARAERAELLPPTARLLIAYFRANLGCRTGALSVGEATLIRGWATTVPGWRERASQGQYPLRFTAYDVEGSDVRDGDGTNPRG